MNLNFSGHQTFPLRQLWPYKATQLLETIDKPFTQDFYTYIEEAYSMMAEH